MMVCIFDHLSEVAAQQAVNPIVLVTRWPTCSIVSAVSCCLVFLALSLGICMLEGLGCLFYPAEPSDDRDSNEGNDDDGSLDGHLLVVPRQSLLLNLRAAYIPGSCTPGCLMQDLHVSWWSWTPVLCLFFSLVAPNFHGLVFLSHGSLMLSLPCEVLPWNIHCNGAVA